MNGYGMRVNVRVLRWLIPLASAALVAGCGANEPGEPVQPARELSEPAPPGGHADVYCLSDGDCDVLLRVSPESSRLVASEWWYRVARTLREHPDPFDYEGERFRWGTVGLFGRVDAPGEWAPVGWRCPEDERLGEEVVRDRMAARDPGQPQDFGTARVAREAGCEIAIYPTRHETLLTWK